MSYRSEFSPADTEILLQHIESIRKYFSPQAQFLLEEKPQVSGSRLVLKVKEGKTLFKADASALNLRDAIFLACKTVTDLYFKSSEYKAPEKLIVLH